MAASSTAKSPRSRAREPGSRSRAVPATAVPRDAAQNFVNRELSWLEFNARVLEQALDASNPLLERLNFLAIVGSNLDEFYMVRVGGLLALEKSDPDRRCYAGLTPREQLDRIGRRAHELVTRQYRCFKELMAALARREIVRVVPERLHRKAVAVAEHHFREELLPALTPIAVDGEPLPEVANLTLHLAVRLRPRGARDAEPKLALIPIPPRWPRFFQLPSTSGYRYMLVEDLVRFQAEEFFAGHEVLEAAVFRLTRNADLPAEEDVELTEMEDALWERHGGAPVRLEVEARASKELVATLTRAFAIAPEALYVLEGPLDLKPFMRLVSKVGAPSLRYPAFEPQPVAAFEDAETPWEVIRERDVLVHHPYDAFTPVLDLLRDAAEDPHVVAIKQTLYRTSETSPIVEALERAARNGKQVTALVEIKARFDEARNIGFARRLTEAGAQVVYGVIGFKTHAKLLLIARREPDGVRRYVHISTGNYNDSTARVYEDVGLFTSDSGFGADASNFFHAVTGYSEPREWNHFVVAPMALRDRLEQLIDREIAASTPSAPGRIRLKLNAFADPKLAAKLYLASQKGVKVQLCVRGACCVRPGLPGLSSNIEVISIVDRFLEHSRIYSFGNGGQEEVYLASADFMRRNLDRRLELMFPVRDEANRQRLLGVLDTVFQDNARAWRMRSDGRYERVRRDPDAEPVRAQERFIEDAFARAEALRVRRMSAFRPLGPGMAPGLRR